MKKEDINIRDPFVLFENGRYYLYGTRARSFGQNVGGFDVYISDDMENWSAPMTCFDSEKYGLNRQVNWAPEVHKFKNRYYLFATFTRENGLRGTFSLVADRPEGPFVPNSPTALTPPEWECLDGTFYVDPNDTPYLVFCHEHTQIIDGTVCYARLNADLTAIEGPVTTLFKASDPFFADEYDPEKHFITDGPFLYRTKTGELLLLWSTFIEGKYAQCLVRFADGTLGTSFTHLPPLLCEDGGHGMIFRDEKQLWLTYHIPNQTGAERPVFFRLEDCGDTLRVLDKR